MSRHHPTEIQLHRASRVLEVHFDDGERMMLPCEYLRVFSPSAEVRGHGLPEPLLVLGKENVTIDAIEPVGQYAIKLVFDDGHDSGLYDWDFLYQLGQDYAINWSRYQARLANHSSTQDESSQISPPR